MCFGPDCGQTAALSVASSGVTGRAQAWREGMALLARNRDQRRFASFQTELEGAIPGYADLVEVSHDVPGGGCRESWKTTILVRSGLLRPSLCSGGKARTTISACAAEMAYLPDLFASSRARMSVRCALWIWLMGKVCMFRQGKLKSLPTTFGPGERRALLAQVMRAVPSEAGLWTLNVVNYAPSVHTAELGGQEPEFASPSLLPIVPLGPIVDSVTVFSGPRPGQQIVSATPASGAYRYEFEASDDGGVHWQPLGMAELPSLEVYLRAGSWQVRVRGIGALSGPWKTWQGNVSASAHHRQSSPALTTISQVMAIELAWTVPDAPWMSSVEIWESSTPNLGMLR